MKIPEPRIIGLCRAPASFTEFIDEIPMGIMITDLDRRVRLLNRTLEALTGFLSEEVCGIPCRYVLRSDLCFHACPLLKVSERHESVCCEASIINKSRKKLHVRMVASAITDHLGRPLGFMESVEEICSHQGESLNEPKIPSLSHLIGRSPEMQRIIRVIPAIAQTDSSILITGQTGTGKDYIAEAIHYASNRSQGPFVKVNCGALPEALLESELFGHQKGAFTGAVENKPGRFRLAHNGTLYLTEIGDLPLNLQVKLLSFLDDKVVHPLGSTKGVHVDVRVIAATHRNLEAMVREGRFREDLLFRLNVVRIHLPALAQRGDDRRILMDHFLYTFNPRFGKQIRGFSPEVRDLLSKYRFPGNIRELRNVVEYAVNVCDGNEILLNHLPAYLTESPAQEKTENGYAEDDADVTPLSLEKGASMAGDTWEAMERRMILEAMRRTRGRRSEAARLLGWGRSTLWRKLKRYGIVP